MDGESHFYIWFDIELAAVVTPLDCELNVEVYRIYDRVGNCPIYESESSSNAITTHIDEANLFVDGVIRWDGCSYWNFGTGEDDMLHLCGRKQAASLGTLFDRLYKATRELVPKANPDSQQ